MKIILGVHISASLILLLLLAEPPKQGTNHTSSLLHLYNVDDLACLGKSPQGLVNILGTIVCFLL